MLCAILACAAAQPQIQDWAGRARYYAAQDGQAVYRVEQDDVVLDFKNGDIQPANPINPDQSQYTGVGLLVKGRKNVTIRNLNVHGYRFNILVQDSQDVRIENCRLGSSRSIRISRDGSPINTFLDIRNTDVWRTYGAGLWIEKSENVVVRGTEAKGSQNGIILVDSSRCTIVDNDVSYNSGWGIALGRSSRNAVCWNRADFVNRPWAGGWGGDSSAIAVADSSCDNTFVGNSLTHSGDGFFLTHRADRFDEKNRKIELLGPSDGNLISHNDGSWSTANAFEGTFSSGNVYWKNWACDSLAAGFWLGFSNDSLLWDNEIKRNANHGVAIEHGKSNLVYENRIHQSGWAGVGFWASDDWRKTAKPAEGNMAIGNNLERNSKEYELKNSIGSRTLGPAERDDIASQAVGEKLKWFMGWPKKEDGGRALALKPKGWKYYRETSLAKGVEWIQAGDWAPRDFSKDLVAWRQPDPGTLEMMLNEDGVRVAAPFETQFEPTPANPRLVRLSTKADMDIPGQELPVLVSLSSQDGKRKQQIRATLRSLVWSVSWFEWPRLRYEDLESWNALFASPPKWRQITRLLGGDFTGKSPGGGLPTHHFACRATAKFRFEDGRYIFSTLSDDGVRLLIDGKELISRWNHHGPTLDEEAVTLSAGVHEIQVDYCQESGAAILKVDWRRAY
jgi:parallel beta-helix repeat protein